MSIRLTSPRDPTYAELEAVLAAARRLIAADLARPVGVWPDRQVMDATDQLRRTIERIDRHG